MGNCLPDVDERDQLKAEAAALVDKAIREAESTRSTAGWMASPCARITVSIPAFLTPGLFSELVTPYLAR